MTAEEAHQKTKNRSDNIDKTLLFAIEQTIQDAVKCGIYSTFVYLSNEINTNCYVSHLKQLGYSCKLYKDTDNNVWILIINWEEEP